MHNKEHHTKTLIDAQETRLYTRRFVSWEISLDLRERGRKKERGKERERERERKPEGVISLAPLQMPKTTTCEKITDVLSGGNTCGLFANWASYLAHKPTHTEQPLIGRACCVRGRRAKEKDI